MDDCSFALGHAGRPGFKTLARMMESQGVTDGGSPRVDGRWTGLSEELGKSGVKVRGMETA